MAVARRVLVGTAVLSSSSRLNAQSAPVCQVLPSRRRDPRTGGETGRRAGQGFRGDVGRNRHVGACRAGADAIGVDPGQRAFAPLRRILDENRLTPAAVLLTHGHIDHMWSAQKVADTYGCPVYIHPEDRHMLVDPIKGFGPRLAQVAFGAMFREPRQLVD